MLDVSHKPMSKTLGECGSLKIEKIGMDSVYTFDSGKTVNLTQEKLSKLITILINERKYMA